MRCNQPLTILTAFECVPQDQAVMLCSLTLLFIVCRFGSAIEKRVMSLQQEEKDRKDLQVLCMSFLGQLKRVKGTWIAEVCHVVLYFSTNTPNRKTSTSLRRSQLPRLHRLRKFHLHRQRQLQQARAHRSLHRSQSPAARARTRTRWMLM